MSVLVYYSKSLKHDGILGMKWGVRRYRNKDGTLTPAGKERYGNRKKDSGSSNDKGTRRGYPVTRRGVRKMSDQELSSKIDRLKKEKEYLSLVGENIDQGRHYAINTLKSTGNTAVSTFTKTIASAGAAFLAKYLMNKLTSAVSEKEAAKKAAKDAVKDAAK